MENPNFLKNKYDLHNAPETKSAARRTEMTTGEKIPQSPEAQIQNYLNRFTEIIERKEPTEKERGIKALKHILHEKFVIKAEEIPESAFLLEQKIAREQGHGDIEITDEFKKQKTTQIINNQTRSLDKWIDYLSSGDAQYPDWAKYWVFRSMLEMGRLQKEKDENGKENARFKKRTKDTVVSFPSLNPRALALTIGVLRSRLEEKAKPKKEQTLIKSQSVKLNDEEFQRLLSTENFSKIYAQFLIEMPEYSTEKLEEIRGEWVRYEQGSDAHALVKSLEGYPLEWCTADYDTAQGQLQDGAFYVYYSINESGEAIIPRLAIRMQGDQIAEDPRGIAPDQNLDPYIVPVLEEKLKEFGEKGAVYKDKSADMKMLTAIENKTKNSEQLTKDEITFLYEIERYIKGFGQHRDPRISEIRKIRNEDKDLSILFECGSWQIAHNKKEITPNTKVYVGPLFKGIFKLNLEHIYTTFPDGLVEKMEVEIGGKNNDELKNELKNKNIGVSRLADYMLEKIIPSRHKKRINLVSLTVKGLGFYDGATTQEIYDKAESLGLELCPAEVGPSLRLQNSSSNHMLIAMEKITLSEDDVMFALYGGKNGLWLGEGGIKSGGKFHSGRKFIFCFRKKNVLGF